MRKCFHYISDMIFLIAAYLLLQLGLGYWISRRVKNTKDFFLAGKQLPLPLVTVSLVATWFGAETCIGSSGAVYSSGLSGSRADPFGYSLCLLLTGLLLAIPMWKGGYVTIGDFFYRRYGWLSEKITVFILIPGSLFWGAAQIRAFGQIISTTTNLPVHITILLCTVFVVIYTFQGGLLGDIVSDFIQGMVIFIALGILLVVTLKSNDFSLSNWWIHVSAERLSFLTSNESIWQRLDRWSIPILGSLITQELISRTISARSPSVAQRACFWACGIYLIIGSVPVFLGLIGPQLLGNISDPEQFLPLLAQKYLSPALYVVFIGGIVAALLSTIDSIFLSASALTTQNILSKYLIGASPRKELIIARGLIVVAALISYTIAVTSSGIYELVEIASSFGTAGLVVVAIIGLWTTWGGVLAANMGLIGGAISFHIGQHVFDLKAPFITAIVVALLAYWAGALLEKTAFHNVFSKTTNNTHA